MNLSTKFVSIANKICRFIELYWSPSQKQDELQEFKSNIEMNLDALLTNNPFLTVMIGDYNAKSSNLYLNDVTSFEGSKLIFLPLNLLCLKLSTNQPMF